MAAQKDGQKTSTVIMEQEDKEYHVYCGCCDFMWLIVVTLTCSAEPDDSKDRELQSRPRKAIETIQKVETKESMVKNKERLSEFPL